MTQDWISLREFARRRGVTLAAVQKAIETGRVTAVRRAASGRLSGIDAVEATLQWNANTDPAEAAKNGKSLNDVIPPGAGAGVVSAHVGVGAGVTSMLDEPAQLFSGATARSEEDRREGVEDNGPATPAPATSKDPHGYQAARAERERLEVKARELEYAKAVGLVVSVEDLKRVTARRYRAIRDQVLSVPDRVAAALAAERDPAQVHALLDAELKRVLHELSDDAAAEAARGTAERVAA